jgi:folate-binding protein YgfZ
MVKLPTLSAICFSGADAGEFLHSQLSADILALAPGESTFACYCEPKGRVLALMLVGRVDDDYYIIMSSTLLISISNRLKIYVMRAQVSVDVLAEHAITGAHSSDEGDDSIRIGIPETDDLFVIAGNESALSADAGLDDAWKINELERGIVWLDTGTSAQFLPQMLGYDKLGAVNFRKGCYPGQEIVARTHYLGKVKRHPRLLCTNKAISLGPLSKIQIHSAGTAYTAVVVDSGKRKNDGSCVYVVTRMDPELQAENIEVEGQLTPLV